jgi:acetolactate synthase-1/2/3 large subunit
VVWVIWNNFGWVSIRDIQLGMPFRIDAHVDAPVRPPSTGAWELPPTPYQEPVHGRRFIPDAASVN